MGTLKVYLDASVLIAFLTVDRHSERAEAFMQTGPVALVSDLAIAEFGSAMARRVRMRDLTADDARQAFTTLDEWLVRSTERQETSPGDIRSAERFLRRLDLTLRALDAIHIATAARLGAALATFDIRMADAARALGVEIVGG